jgi:hypothetical protein
MKKLTLPVNSKALALYLLLTSGKRGYTNWDATKNESFWKFNTRLSELSRSPYNVFIRKQEEHGVNRFGHSFTNMRYKLYAKDYRKNVKIYNAINIDRKKK